MKLLVAEFFLILLLITPAAAQDTVQVSTGWNIIGSVKSGAIPDVLSTDPPGIISTSFFGYAPSSGYLAADTLELGLGYWVKVTADGTIIFNTTGGEVCGLKTVDYGGTKYRTVQIGTQCWLDRNLTIGTMITGATPQTNNAVVERYCYNDLATNCTAYGGLYQWNEAMQYSTTPGAQGICPTGWHIPTQAELQTLSDAVGGNGAALKALGQGASTGVGTDSSGFAAMLGGVRDSDIGEFADLTWSGHYWTSTEDITTRAFKLYMYDSDTVIAFDDAIKNNGFSVRCLED